jgi:membrane protease YdiL (CAAX protease family)
LSEEKKLPEYFDRKGLAYPNVWRDILIVAAPIVVLGAVGNLVGLSTLSGGAIINLGYLLAIVAGGVILKRQGSGWREIGLAKPASWLLTIFSGLGAWIGAVAAFVLAQAAVVGVFTMLGQSLPEIDQSRFNPVQGNLPLFLLMLVLAWTTIAFGEELFYRAFLISRLIDHGGMRSGFAITISSLIFAVAHFAEGPLGILSNGAFAFFFGWLYVRSGRNLWVTYIGHGLLNTFRFTLLYAGAA